jgi:sugar lactone lactonase YvrE
MRFIKVKYLLPIFLLANLLVLGQPEGSIYFTDASYNNIFRLENNKIDTIISTGLGFPWRLATDGNYLYWTSVDTNLIEKANMDGTNRQQLAVITYPEGITVNRQTGDLFISEAGTPAIIKMAPPNYLPDTLYTNGLADPDNIIYSSITDKLYWVDVALGQIIEATTDGEKMTILFANADYEPQAIIIDDNAKFIYWADTKKKGICKLNNATQEVEMMISNLVKPTALALDKVNNTIFWLDAGTKTIGWKKFGESETHSFKIEQISDFHSGLLFVAKAK